MTSTSSNTSNTMKVDSLEFYANYHGHLLSHLHTLYQHLKHFTLPLIYLAGDSSLDNKHWLYGSRNKHNPRVLYDPRFTAGAPWQYKDVLRPPRSVQDIAYHMNNELEANNQIRMSAINCAVEESTLNDRTNSQLLPHDLFVRDHITPHDTLTVSVGGNDVALRPTLSTMFHMMMLISSPTRWIHSGNAPGLHHFVKMFRDRTTEYIELLTTKQMPHKILVCMIYLPDRSNEESSWADTLLSRLGYDQHPEKLQLIMKKVYEMGTCQVEKKLRERASKRNDHERIKHVSIIPIPLFEVLDGTTHSDYIQRVEPSVSGGKKVAQYLLQHIL